MPSGKLRHRATDMARKTIQTWREPGDHQSCDRAGSRAGCGIRGKRSAPQHALLPRNLAGTATHAFQVPWVAMSQHISLRCVILLISFLFCATATTALTASGESSSSSVGLSAMSRTTRDSSSSGLLLFSPHTLCICTTLFLFHFFEFQYFPASGCSSLCSCCL